ncbi:MAG: hypothetical protein U1D55_09090 [Phycisphaerae bacterium]
MPAAPLTPPPAESPFANAREDAFEDKPVEPAEDEEFEAETDDEEMDDFGAEDE